MTRRWRLLVHALDRTGPPMLALSFRRWLARHHPGLEVDLVAFRPGELVGEAAGLGPVHLLLEPHEPWDHAAPPGTRAAAIARRLAGDLPPADLTLLVSVAAGQSLPYLPPDGGPVVAWVVESGEDLHWLDGALDLGDRVDRWLAGPDVVADELSARLAAQGRTPVLGRAPEFVDEPSPPSVDEVASARSSLGAGPDELLVLGAGIGTHRKAPDLFLEVALAVSRRRPSRFVWVGGEHDPLVPLLVEETRRLSVEQVRFVPSVADLDPLLAAADVFLHPARLDAFPLVCLSAAASRTPVVAFAGAGGVEEMMGDAFLGAPYPDVGGLGDVVVGLGDPHRRSAAANRQRDAVVRCCTTDHAAPRLYDLLVGEAA